MQEIHADYDNIRENEQEMVREVSPGQIDRKNLFWTARREGPHSDFCRLFLQISCQSEHSNQATNITAKEAHWPPGGSV